MAPQSILKETSAKPGERKTTAKPTGRLRKTACAALAIAASATVVFLLLEISYRFYLFKWDGLSFTKMNSVHPIGSSGLLEPSRYSDIIFELKPNMKTHFKLKRFETNAQGFRDKKYSLEKPDGTFRVAVIGDSFTMPSGVDIEEAYHSVLEARMNARSDGTSYEFINFGVGGYYLLQYYGVLTRKATHYNPDMILIGFCAFNDQRVIPDKLLKEPYQVLRKTNPAFASFVWDTISKRLFPQKEATAEDSAEDDARAKAIKNYWYVKDIFESMGEFSSTAEVPVVIAYLATYPVQVEPIKSLAEEQGLYFVDTSSALGGLPLREVTINKLDPHPNPRAHKIFAEQIHNYLVAQGLLPQL